METKYRILGSLAVTALLLALILLPIFSEEEDPIRYHQHLEEPGYTPCTDHGDEVFCTHLPIVVIDTEGQDVPGEIIEGAADRFGEDLYTTAADGTNYINVSVSVIDSKEGNNHLSDQPVFSTRSLFRIRGHTTRLYEKKSYLCKFVDENGMDNDIEVLGMDAHNEWALYAPYQDKDLIRNYLWYNISGEIMEWAPNARFCEVFLNNEYIGLYLLVETVTNGETGRLNLKDTIKGNDFAGYLLRVDAPTEEDLESVRDIYSFTERIRRLAVDVSIRYPGQKSLTPEIKRKIELEYSEFEKALYSYDHDTEDYGYWNYIDEDSFVDYFIINEFTMNYDVGTRSTYIYKEPGQKYKMCVWDFNGANDNFHKVMSEPYGLQLPTIIWYRMLVMDETFINHVIDRYKELRKSWLSDEFILNYIDETIAWLGPAVDRNYEVWGSAFDIHMLEPDERNPADYQEAVGLLKTACVNRGAWLDAHIDDIQYLSHPSNHKRWEH